MSAAQDETFSPHNIAVLGFLLAIALFIGEVVIGPDPGSDEEMAAAVPLDTVEDIALRLKPVITLAEIRNNVTMAAAAADSSDKTPSQLYQGACLACHTTGAAGAPKIGDAAAWGDRLAKGMDALVSAAVQGIGAMPPRGGSQYNDEQIRAVVEYILAESK